MNVEQIAKVLDAISKLVSSLAWPAVTLFVLIRFGPALREFLANLGEVSLKGAGFEATGKRRQSEATAALTAAAAARPENADAPESAARDAREAAQLVSELVTPRTIRRAGQALILWVDDRPDNNIYERQAMEAVGISFTLATSTEEALRELKEGRFNAIISDMGRPPDATAGYTLLDKLRASGDRTPYIIYAGSRALEHQAEARKRGAIGCTNRPNELFEMVMHVLGRWQDS